MRAAVTAIGAESSRPVSLQMYAVVGAAAFLAGSVRYKTAAVLITLESTGAWVLAVPITIAGALRCRAARSHLPRLLAVCWACWPSVNIMPCLAEA